MALSFSDNARDFLMMRGSFLELIQGNSIYIYSGTRPNVPSLQQPSDSTLLAVLNYDAQEPRPEFNPDIPHSPVYFLKTTVPNPALNVGSLLFDNKDIFTPVTTDLFVAVKSWAAIITRYTGYRAIPVKANPSEGFSDTGIILTQAMLTRTPPSPPQFSSSGNLNISIIELSGNIVNNGLYFTKGSLPNVPNSQSGVVSKEGGRWAGIAIGNGTATWFRIPNAVYPYIDLSNGGPLIIEGSVGTFNADLVLSSTSFVEGALVVINSCAFMLP